VGERRMKKELTHRFVQVSDCGFCKEVLHGRYYILGASGLRMQYEVYKQLQEKAGPRQVKDPRLGLTHNLGGAIWGGISCISITGNELSKKMD